ncbi:hypothetical protein NW768_008326 [Fusarium equiseti]|uniref:Uncharacterized protein n=1 Tax=Fusarium equiseti TaxID=61235 RepID=A0ABQ8R6X0_FUSEQ|nr:hypothetical protein NW768_008326 [Fusarium equiseti]
MSSFEDYSGDVIPEIKTDAYTISGQTLFSVEAYGKKWYERGVEAGLAQATGEIGDLDWTFPSESHEETTNSLAAENDELKRQVKEMKVYKDIALYAQNSLGNIALNTANLLSVWNGGSCELYRKLLELDAQTQAAKEECHRKMDKVSGKA